MNRIALGIVTGGAVAGAFFTAGIANADDATPPAPSWTPVYDTDSAQVLQDTDPSSTTWSLPAVFTNDDGTVLSGTNYVTQNAWGGIDDQFVDSDTGSIYDQNQLFPGFTTLYYDADGVGDGADPVAFLKTPLGNFDLSWMASSFAPADLSEVDPWTAEDAATNAGLYSALNLGLGEDAPADATWSPVYNLDDAELVQATGLSSPTWAIDSTFTYGAGTDAVTLDGTSYITQSLGGYDDVFVTEDGAVFDQDQLGLGFTNLYYNPGEDGDIVDMLKTPFGTFDISWAASWFTPTDFSEAVDAQAGLVADGGLLTDAGLYSALDLGLVPDAAEAIDPFGWLGL